MAENLAQLDALINLAAQFNQKGWTPATSSNFSLRNSDQSISITESGHHKGFLKTADFLTVDINGVPTDKRKPSAETGLHTLIYKTFENAACVLHTHSPQATVISMASSDATSLRFAGYEILKAFPGIHTHESEVYLPIFDNSQDIDALAQQVRENLRAFNIPAFLIRGHGLYVWGDSLDAANRHIEAVEFLLTCELLHRSYTR